MTCIVKFFYMFPNNVSTEFYHEKAHCVHIILLDVILTSKETPAEVTYIIGSLIKIDDVASQRRNNVNILMRKGFLEFEYCNNRLKLVLVTCK